VPPAPVNGLVMITYRAAYATNTAVPARDAFAQATRTSDALGCERHPAHRPAHDADVQTFGHGVALYSDGNTALIGGPNDSTGPGAAWAFVSPPAVTGLSPAGGSAAGGTSVTISANNLTGATAVKFGSVSAASFKVQSPSSIPPAVDPPVGLTLLIVGNPLG
jgi:hypothetical protein